MDARPPIRVVLDLSTLLAGDSKAWKDYKRVGTCYVPKVVFDAMEFLKDRAAETEQEKAAKEFMMFWPKSGWQLTSASAGHPKLQPAEGAAVSKQARLSLAIARCAYGLSQEYADEIVVFVSNTQPLLKRIQALHSSNLCAITPSMLLQWCRRNQPPDGLTEMIEKRVKVLETPIIATASKKRSPAPIGKKPATTRQSRQPVAKRQSTPKRSQTPVNTTQEKRLFIPEYRHVYQVRGLKTNFFSRLMSGFVALVMLAAIVGAIGFLWKISFPKTFNPFWQKQVEPMLKKLPPLPGTK